MLKNNQSGIINPLVMPMALLVVSTLGFAGFGIWSYTQYSDINQNLDAKVVSAVKVQEAEIRKKVDLDFKEKEKLPTRSYLSPASSGSVGIKYPKTWSVHADEKESGVNELDVYMHPGFVRTLEGDDLHALRVTLVDRQYATVLKQYDRKVEDGDIKSKSVKVANVKGVRLNGQIDTKITGSLVLLPIRDKTLMIWTESDEFKADFDKVILPNLTFIP